MPSEPDEKLFRQYCRARDAGDRDRAREVWEELSVFNFDRINQLVSTFRFSAATGGLPPHERGSAATEAYLRVVSMGANFRESEIYRYRAALHSCVHNACRDYGRKELRHDMRAGGSVDQTYEPGGEAGPYDSAMADYDAELRARTADAVERELSRQEAEGLVAWAISKITNANYREVLELTLLEQLDAEQIAERIQITTDNVYARRSRGHKELEEILRGSQS